MPTYRDYSNDDDDRSIPSVIYVKPSTFMCRWDTGCEDGISIGSSESTSDEDCFRCSKRSSPPRSPTRVPSRRSMKKRFKSMKSGVDIHNVNLEEVQVTPTGAGAGAVVSVADDMRPNKTLANVLQREGGVGPTVVFCIRRAGCGSCRDHGQKLAQLARTLDFQFNLFGIIKETAVDDEALTDFYKDYFPFSLYIDQKWDAFRFLGNRKMSVWQLLKGHAKMASHYRKEGIENKPFGGDLFTQGGVLLFDKEGKLRYVYYERYGKEFDLDAIKWAILDCQRGKYSKIKNAGTSQEPPKCPSRCKSTVSGGDASPPKQPFRRKSTDGTEDIDTAVSKLRRSGFKIGVA